MFCVFYHLEFYGIVFDKNSFENLLKVTILFVNNLGKIKRNEKYYCCCSNTEFSDIFVYNLL